ncbi:MAG: GNAT family N-acetyltransferase [Acidimicrobiales bacterium]|jgi:ribosomal-protein-alanine N-acetyltransferase
MTDGPGLWTERLHLRRWKPPDQAPFAALNADPVVMEHFPSLLTTEESAAFIERAESSFEERGYGWWALESRDGAEFLGFVGLGMVRPGTPCAPAVETGWRLARPAWGHGYATEAARAAVAFGFDELGLDEIVAFTVPGNRRSQAVMARLGMTRDPDDDFDHPSVPVGHPLRRHVLYRLGRSAWEAPNVG